MYVYAEIALVLRYRGQVIPMIILRVLEGIIHKEVVSLAYINLSFCFYTLNVGIPEISIAEGVLIGFRARKAIRSLMSL